MAKKKTVKKAAKKPVKEVSKQFVNHNEGEI